MPFNFYDTHTLLMAVQQLTPAATFLRGHCFPSGASAISPILRESVSQRKARLLWR